MAGSLGGDDIREEIGARGYGLGDLKVPELWISQALSCPLQQQSLDRLGHVGQEDLGRVPNSQTSCCSPGP